MNDQNGNPAAPGATMNNRIKDLLPPEPASRERSQREDSSRKNRPAERSLLEWSLQHPVKCLATAFALGAIVAWFVKRR